MGDGVYCEKWDLGRGVLKGVYGVKIEKLRTGDSQIPTGKISEFFCKIFLSREKFLKNVSEKFFENYFGVGNYFREKFCPGPLNYFS